MGAFVEMMSYQSYYRDKKSGKNISNFGLVFLWNDFNYDFVHITLIMMFFAVLTLALGDL